jgi:hypothetical protein
MLTMRIKRGVKNRMKIKIEAVALFFAVTVVLWFHSPSVLKPVHKRTKSLLPRAA